MTHTATAREAEAIKAMGLTWPRPTPPDRPRADASPRARRPLGLRPIIDPGDEPEDDTPEPEPPAREDNRPAWLSDIDFLIRHERKSSNKFTFAVIGEVIGEVMAEIKDELRRELEGELAAPAQAHEIAELKNTIGAMQNETTALKLILEGLRIRERGEQDRDGDRGPPGVAGRDGLQGPIGPAGPQGERGLPTPKIVSWEPDFVKFTATPLLSNGDLAIAGAAYRLQRLDGQRRRLTAPRLCRAEAGAATRRSPATGRPEDADGASGQRWPS